MASEDAARSAAELLAGLADPAWLGTSGAPPITGLYDDSRRVRPGGLFVAVAGTQADGRRFVGDAIARGACMIVGQDLPPQPGVVVVNVPDVRAALARLALRWHGLADAGPGGLPLAGVTGTNGKSTTAFMTQAILHAAGVRCALFGTVHYDVCRRTIPATNTTPGALELAGYLREAQDAGARAAVLEVSSHALDQKRTDGLRFAAAAFTNLTGDHLDYHGTMENYGAAKARLFTALDPDAVAVVNRDDAHHAQLVRGCRARVVTYGIDGAADLRARIVSSTSRSMRYGLCVEGREIELESALVGRHNVYNALAAAGLARALGVELAAITAGLADLPGVPGRLQRVDCASPADVFVDYAHSDDSLRNVLCTLRPVTRGKLIVMFGCGGERDRTKRPRMARVAAEYADAIVVTSDNPRCEDPHAIIAEVLTGFAADDRPRVAVEPDRARAIRAALARGREGDVVLLAGKGHEDYQVVGTQRLPFDDVQAARQAAAELYPAVQGVG